MCDLYEPITTTVTSVTTLDGEELAVLDGIVQVKPKDYEQHLPIRVTHIRLTSEVITTMTIDKK